MLRTRVAVVCSDTHVVCTIAALAEDQCTYKRKYECPIKMIIICGPRQRVKSKCFSMTIEEDMVRWPFCPAVNTHVVQHHRRTARHVPQNRMQQNLRHKQQP